MTARLDVGSWGLFCGHGGRQLVLIDDQPCGPSSARKQLQRLPRALLLDEDRMSRAYEAPQGLLEKVEHCGQDWVVALRPMLSPRSGCLVGVLGGVFPVGTAIPAAPEVGIWEWEIERDRQGQPTPRRRTYWDRVLFRLYGVDPGVAQQRQGYWEAGDWVNELIDRSDQMRVNSLIRDGIHEGLQGIAGVFRCLTYNVVTGYGSERLGRRHLRLVGMVVPVEPSDEKIVLQGFSYEAPETFHDMAFGQDANAGRVDDVLRGVMALAKEPVAVVDAATLDVLTTSASWRREDFGHVGGLGEFAIDDSSELRDFIRAAAEDTERTRSMKVDLRRTDGSVQSVEMLVIGVRSGSSGHDAVVRLDL